MRTEHPNSRAALERTHLARQLARDFGLSPERAQAIAAERIPGTGVRLPNPPGGERPMKRGAYSKARSHPAVAEHRRALRELDALAPLAPIDSPYFPDDPRRGEVGGPWSPVPRRTNPVPCAAPGCPRNATNTIPPDWPVCYGHYREWTDMDPSRPTGEAAREAAKLAKLKPKRNPLDYHREGCRCIYHAGKMGRRGNPLTPREAAGVAGEVRSRYARSPRELTAIANTLGHVRGDAALTLEMEALGRARALGPAPSPTLDTGTGGSFGRMTTTWGRDARYGNPSVPRPVAEAWRDLAYATRAGASDDELAQLEYELGLTLKATGTPMQLVFGGRKGRREGRDARYRLVPTRAKNPAPTAMLAVIGNPGGKSIDLSSIPGGREALARCSTFHGGAGARRVRVVRIPDGSKVVRREARVYLGDAEATAYRTRGARSDKSGHVYEHEWKRKPLLLLNPITEVIETVVPGRRLARDWLRG